MHQVDHFSSVCWFEWLYWTNFKKTLHAHDIRIRIKNCSPFYFFSLASIYNTFKKPLGTCFKNSTSLKCRRILCTFWGSLLILQWSEWWKVYGNVILYPKKGKCDQWLNFYHFQHPYLILRIYLSDAQLKPLIWNLFSSKLPFHNQFSCLISSNQN